MRNSVILSSASQEWVHHVPLVYCILSDRKGRCCGWYCGNLIPVIHKKALKFASPKTFKLSLLYTTKVRIIHKAELI